MSQKTTGSKGEGSGRKRKPKVLSKDGIVKTVTGESFLQKRVAFAWSESLPMPIQEVILKAYTLSHFQTRCFTEMMLVGNISLALCQMNHVFYAAIIRMASDLYKKKIAAFGWSHQKRREQMEAAMRDRFPKEKKTAPDDK
jgi:hypothetical protein